MYRLRFKGEKCNIFKVTAPKMLFFGSHSYLSDTRRKFSEMFSAGDALTIFFGGASALLGESQRPFFQAGEMPAYIYFFDILRYRKCFSSVYTCRQIIVNTI